MVLNRRGQVMLLGVMLFVFSFIVAVLLTSPVRTMTDTARDVDHLNCDANNLTTGVALTCVAVDLTLPFFIITVILSGAGLITSKLAGS